MYPWSRRIATLAGVLCLALLLPTLALAQDGIIEGTVRDADGILPGVVVEVRSPALIERVRSTVSESNGRYRVAALPIGTYEVTFTLPSFATTRRENIVVSSGASTTVDVAMRPGDVTEQVTVIGTAPDVDVTRPGTRIALSGDDIKELPTTRNLSSLMVLVPGLEWQTGVFNDSSACIGGAGAFCTPNVIGFNVHTDPGLGGGDGNQGQLRVDGQLLNSASGGIFGNLSGYLVDVANAQEVSFNLTGALGESETGGASINIIPRTGGNSYRGNYSTTYTSERWRDRNRQTRLIGTGSSNTGIIQDHDVSGSFGGPILRDRLWFYSVLRTQGKEAYPGGQDFFYNKNAGIWAGNYIPDRSRGQLTYTTKYTNANVRMTLQASPRNKFNLFWDEQDACQDPCRGAVSSTWSPEANWSARVAPNRLQQLSWTNPFTNRLLLEGGISVVAQHYDFTNHRYETNPQHLPQISEGTDGSQCCVGLDEISNNVHTGVSSGTGGVLGLGGHPNGGTCFLSFTVCSGSIASASINRQGNARPRLSASYITGSHNAKVGWEAQYFWERENTLTNGPQLNYFMTSPSATCDPTLGGFEGGCGVPNLHDPNEVNNPGNFLRRPVPVAYGLMAGNRSDDQRLSTQALYVQDQWTVNRFTLNGALRYDHAGSNYNPTCLDANVFISPEVAWCSPENRGPRFHDITPRWGVAWDVFGDGKTALKWNMGRYNQAARFGGVFNDANLGSGAQYGTAARGWNDLNGDRLIDCNVFDPRAQGPDGYHVPVDVPAGDFCAGVNVNNLANFGVSPVQSFTGTFICGKESVMREEMERNPDLRVPNFADQYCGIAGQNLYEGWGKRRGEWQFGLGIQREILPRLTAEVTYNERWTRNVQVNDSLQWRAVDNPNSPHAGLIYGSGCDLYDLTGFSPANNAGVPQGPVNVFTGTTAGCNESMLNLIHPHWSFYSVQAPLDPRLPNGGGYWMHGLETRTTPVNVTNIGTVATQQKVNMGWRGIDTNFVLRARGGLRLNGGTSSGGSTSDTCMVSGMVNGPGSSVQFSDVDPVPGCRRNTPWRTNVRGSASYTIPWIDVLASSVFQYRPGPSISANVTYRVTEQVAIPTQGVGTATSTVLYRPTIQWDENSAWRATNTGTGSNCPATGAVSVGCIYGANATATTVTENLLRTGDLYGPGYFNIDLKLAKNIRFARRRVNIGMDVYNLFNTDAATSYNGTYSPTTWTDDSGTHVANPWMSVTNILSPRFARFSVQFDF